jgi:two-component system phosphate regulon response regulator PhoB
MLDRKSNRVLIVDDEPEVVDLVQMVLNMGGYSVSSARDGQEALAAIRAEPPDLILLDVRMPKMSGLRVLEQLQTDPATAPIPVIMLSVVTTYPEVREALEQGAIAYLAKPFRLKEMSLLVDRVLAMDGAQRETFRQQALNNIGVAW